MNKDLVVIVSGGRTGTKFFGQVLGDCIEDAFSVHEPDIVPGPKPILLQRIRRFGVWHMIVGRLLGRTGLRNLSRARLTGRINDEDAVGELKKQRSRYYATIPEPLVIESNAQWFGILPVLRRAYPRAKVVAISRDPRTWVRSSLAHAYRRGYRDWVSLFGQKRLNPILTNDKEWSAHWDSMSVFEKTCWDWQATYRPIVSFAASDPRTRLYRFEDVFTDFSTFRDLVEFACTHEGHHYSYQVDEELQRTRINAAHRKVADWEEWSPQQAAFLDRMCGELMKELGHGGEREWAEKVARGRELG